MTTFRKLQKRYAKLRDRINVTTVQNEKTSKQTTTDKKSDEEANELEKK